MSCFRPPFQGADPAWTDGCGFLQKQDPVIPVTNEQRGSLIIPIGAERVTVVFDPALTLGTDYDIEAWTENTKTGDPDESIFPTVVITRNQSATNELGFTQQFNSAPTTGPGTIDPLTGPNSYTRFKWRAKYYA